MSAASIFALRERFFTGSGKEAFVYGECEFAQRIHGFVRVFAHKLRGILRKGYVQKPMHRFYFPMLLNDFRKLLCRRIQAGNVIVCK